MMAGRNGGRKPSPLSKKSSATRRMPRDSKGRFVSSKDAATSAPKRRCKHPDDHAFTNVRPIGRFKGFRTVLVVDEVGNSGKDPKEHEEFFGYAVSVTTKPDEFGALTDTNRWKKDGELKARDDNDTSNRTNILRGVRRLGTKTYGYFLVKKDPPVEWNDSERPKAVKAVLSNVLDDVIPNTKGNVFVVVDNSSIYKGGIRSLIKSKSTTKRIVDGDKFDSKDTSGYGDILQTHDYVASALHHHVFSGDKKETSFLGMIVKKLPGRRSK